MSLSSLSSGDEKILNADGTKLDTDPASQVNTFGPSLFGQQPSFPGGDPYFHLRGIYGNATGYTAAVGTNFAGPGTSNAAFSTFGYPQHNGYPHYVDMNQSSTDPSVQSLPHSDQNTQDPYAASIEYVKIYIYLDNAKTKLYFIYYRTVVDRIVAEIKQILRKDFTKRMVEGTAFKCKTFI